MSVSGAVGLAVLTFVLGLLFGRLMGRSGPPVHSFGNDSGPGTASGSASFETAQRRAMGLPSAPEAAAAPFAGAGPDFEAPGAGAPGSFRIVLTEPGHNKINTIKAIREVTHLGLKDSKDLCEGAPTLLARANSQAEANRIAQRFDGIAMVRVEQG